MQRRLLVITLILSFTTVAVGFYVPQQQAEAEQPSPVGSAVPIGTAQGLEAARAQVKFHVRAAGWLPFARPTPVAMVKHLPQDVTSVDVAYAVGPRNYVVITTIDHPATLISDHYELREVSLGGGQSATFLDNGTVQILSWTEGGMTYKITAASPSRSYTAADLVRIADTLE